MSEITAVPLNSDTVALKCPKCDLHLTPRDIAASTGVSKFAILEGHCPLCVLNSLIEGQPVLVNPNVKETPDA